MGKSHQDNADNNLVATEDARWIFNKKSQLWVSKHKKPTGFEEKTLWDKLNLFGTLAIPLIIALATIGFGLLQLHLADVCFFQGKSGPIYKRKVRHLKTEPNKITNEKCATLQVKSAPGFLLFQRGSASSN